ncbi:MAG TPA: heme NO-binding domain-containing protein [Terracidiphilus sp.]
MKGTVVKCIEELVGGKFGAAKWKECLKNAGLPESKLYSTFDDVPDAEVMAIIKAIAVIASLSLAQVMSAFGEYWSTVYAPRVYKSYFDAAKSTRQFLLNLDNVHVAMTRSVKSAKPPRFSYEWQGDKHLVMHYASERGMVALMPGLVAGLGKYYKDHPNVRLVGNAVHVQFA